MTDRRTLAERALVSTCVYLVLTGLGTENDDMWLGVLQDLLPDCQECPLALAQIRSAARILTEAKRQHDRGLAMARLRIEVFAYCAEAAGARISAWQEASASRVLEDCNVVSIHRKGSQ